MISSYAGITGIGPKLRKLKRLVTRTVFVALKIACEPFLVVTRPPIVIFDDIRGHRYPTYLLTAFIECGGIVLSARDLHRAWSAMRLRFFWTRVRLTTSSLVSNRVYFLTGRSNSKIRDEILLDENYFHTLNPSQDYKVPYFAHPTFYSQKIYLKCRRMRENSRTTRLFFAGTLSEAAYSTEFRFPILNRAKILSYVLQNFAVADSFGTSYDKDIVFITTDNTEDRIDKYSLDMKSYIEATSRADFFLCPPGFRIPHSHNLIEAMSVGTVPILNYIQFVHPPLKSGVNCLAFDTLEELGEIIERVLNMREEEISLLRAGVIEYYDKYIDPAAAGREMMVRLPGLKRLIVNAERA